MRLLYRFRFGDRLGELVVLGVEAGPLLGPQRPDELAGFLQPVGPVPFGAERQPEHRVLVLRPARAEAELQPASGQVINFTAALASTAGWRYVLPVTMQPIRVLEVATAIPASSVQASKIGPSSRGPRVAKWSMHQKWSNPASSATRHTARSWSMVAFWLSLSP